MMVNVVLECYECGIVSTSLYDEGLEVIIDIPQLTYTVSVPCPECGDQIDAELPISKLEAELIEYLPTEDLTNVTFVE